MFRKTFLLRLITISAITLFALLWFVIAPQSKVQNAAIAAQPPSTDPLMVNPVAWSVLAAPIYLVKGTDGRIHLIYRTHLRSMPVAASIVPVWVSYFLQSSLHNAVVLLDC